MFFKAMNAQIDDAISVINNLTDNTKFEELREPLFHSIVSAVHFIADCEERVRGKLSEEDSLYLKAFLYVNNQLKHDVSLSIFYFDVSGSVFPMKFPMRFGKPGVYWKNFDDNGSRNARGKRYHYENALMNKDIEVSLQKAREILNTYNI